MRRRASHLREQTERERRLSVRPSHATASGLSRARSKVRGRSTRGVGGSSGSVCRSVADFAIPPGSVLQPGRTGVVEIGMSSGNDAGQRGVGLEITRSRRRTLISSAMALLAHMCHFHFEDGFLTFSMDWDIQEWNALDRQWRVR